MTSRWMIPFWCACSSAAAASAPQRAIWRKVDSRLRMSTARPWAASPVDGGSHIRCGSTSASGASESSWPGTVPRTRDGCRGIPGVPGPSGRGVNAARRGNHPRPGFGPSINCIVKKWMPCSIPTVWTETICGWSSFAVCGLGFVGESLQPARRVEQGSGRKNLERPTRRAQRRLFGFVHDPHSAAAYFADQPKISQFVRRPGKRM